MRSIGASLCLIFGLALTSACGGLETGACQLEAETDACPECADGTTTCTYDDFSATEVSCGECQARQVLYSDMCAAGIEDTRESIEADVTCETVALTE